MIKGKGHRKSFDGYSVFHHLAGLNPLLLLASEQMPSNINVNINDSQGERMNEIRIIGDMQSNCKCWFQVTNYRLQPE